MDKNTKFATKVKSIRERQNMSIDELAEKSGVKKEILVDIENGETVPSLTPLTKMARALGVRLGTFLDDEAHVGPIVVRNGEPEDVIYFSGREDETQSSHLQFHPLGAGKIDRCMDPFIIDITPTEEHDLSSHEGEEFIYVLEGEIQLNYGKDTINVSAGDSLYYDSVVDHHLHAINGKAKILAVLYTPI